MRAYLCIIKGRPDFPPLRWKVASMRSMLCLFCSGLFLCNRFIRRPRYGKTKQIKKQKLIDLKMLWSLRICGIITHYCGIAATRKKLSQCNSSVNSENQKILLLFHSLWIILINTKFFLSFPQSKTKHTLKQTKAKQNNRNKQNKTKQTKEAI